MKTTRWFATASASSPSGGAALVISTDLDELLDICDRIAVLSRGRVVGIVDNGPERSSGSAS